MRACGKTETFTRTVVARLQAGEGVTVYAPNQSRAWSLERDLRARAKQSGVDASRLTVEVGKRKILGKSFAHCVLDTTFATSGTWPAATDMSTRAVGRSLGILPHGFDYE